MGRSCVDGIYEAEVVIVGRFGSSVEVREPNREKLPL